MNVLRGLPRDKSVLALFSNIVIRHENYHDIINVYPNRKYVAMLLIEIWFIVVVVGFYDAL